MSDQPLPDLTNPAPKDIGQEPSPPQSLPSLGQSVPVALTPQSETSNVSSPALNDHANTTSIDFSKATNGLQDTILSDILKAAAATPDLLQIPAISTSALLMSQTQGPTTTLTVPPVIEPAFVGSISRSTLDTMENRSISADKHQPGITATSAGENTQSTSISQDLERSISQSNSLPWQELLMNMLSDLGFVESSRMMAAEELVLSLKQLGNAPRIIAKYTKQLQLDHGKGSGSSKRLNVASESSTMDVDGQETIKRRRVEDGGLLVQMDATRHEIEEKMAQFMAAKREQINESNRQEFIKGRQSSDGSDQPVEDDGCARVDARKLNRTIQMKLETVKNEALTKTNPKNVAQAADTNDSNYLDERLRNIQVHLNLRFAATPNCTLAERIRIIEDVIIQLEREYPLWSALHFNQPNRSFPPPPSVTTVSRNSRNQIVMTGDHLATTLIENGDPLANGVVPGSQYPIYTVAQSGGSGSGTQSSSRTGSVLARATPAISRPQADKAGTAPGAGRVAPATTAATGSATVIKLKRHGGAGSSSLARAVQQQLAQRKAAAGGFLPDDPKTAASTPSFKITPSPYGEHAELGSSSNLAKSGSGAVRMSSPGSSPGSSLSPTIGFPDPSKPGVTGRGPIKSRRKSIAKGLDPASALASMNVAHAGGGHILGTNPGSLMTATSALGSPTTQASQSSIPGSSPSTSTPKPKTAAAKKPRKKKGEEEGDLIAKGGPQVASGRGKGGFGLGKGKSGRPLAMGLGLGKGKGGAYREEILRRAEVEDFDDGSDDDMDEDDFQQSSQSGSGGNGTMTHHPNPLAAPGAHVRNMTLAANNKPAGSEQYQAPKSKKKPQKPSTPAKPPAIRKFGGKSFGMAGGESSDSNESSDDGGSGSSGSQSDTSSSSSISGSDPGDSD
ncbi:hypothetical protein BG006_009455 [Podila minutissima]|uniref:Uncharacterized protein n=1 Tax=Podila minutissima TaxID=64525 RepID=A0A9P5VPZ6_9FUNG|nr:hypothetical protein BG006_009455 [Podila minutissima]